MCVAPYQGRVAGVVPVPNLGRHHEVRGHELQEKCPEKLGPAAATPSSSTLDTNPHRLAARQAAAGPPWVGRQIGRLDEGDPVGFGDALNFKRGRPPGQDRE